VPWIQGDSYGWTPLNGDHARYWTTRFPVEALFPMAAVEDRVVSADRIEDFYRRLTVEPRQLVPVEDVGDPNRHILAGDILSPGATAQVRSHIVDFVAKGAARAH
jgi:hypothetical protein